MNHILSSAARRFAAAFFFLSATVFCTTAVAQAPGEAVEVTGGASVVVFDDFQSNRSETRYYIVDEKSRKERRLHFTGTANGEAPASFKTGRKFKVRGRGRPDGIEVESIEALDGSGTGGTDQSPAEAALAAPETRKVLTLLVDFNDAVVTTGTSNGSTVQQVKDRMYNETKSVAGLFFNSSLGTLTLDPDSDNDTQQDVFHVSINDSYIGGDSAQCSPSTWVSLASQEFERVTGKSVDIYDHRLLITPNYWDYGNRHCSWGGVAQVGCYNWCWALAADPRSILHGVIIHELGHNLGFNHARTDQNNNGYNSSENTDSEYGDKSDMMGSSRSWMKFNPPHAEDKGWVDPVEFEIREVTPTGSVQSFELLPLDEEYWDWPGLRALKLERSSNTDYYVTYRRRAGEYNNLNSPYYDKVNVYYGFDNSTYSYFVTTLSAGETFTDTARDFVITVTSPVTVNDSQSGTSTTAMGVEVCQQACSSTPAPSGLNASAQSTTTIQLGWQDNSSDEDGFDIQRSPDGSSWSDLDTTAPEATSYLDSNLAVGTTYHYRVRASSPVEDSGWSNTANAQTDAIPPAAAFTWADSYLDVDFSDTSTDDLGVVAWSWDFGDGGSSSLQSPSHSYSGEGTWGVTLTVTDSHGETDSASSDVTVFAPPPPPYTDHPAAADTFGAGSVSGTYAATAGDDEDSVQSITERDSGGRKSNRYSYLEHGWVFNIPAGTAATLTINAWQSSSVDGDSFRFEWSPDGNNWTVVLSTSSHSDGTPVDFELPPDTSGTVYLRVTDTDQEPGSRDQDTVHVDFLRIRVSNEPQPPLEGTAPVIQEPVTATHDEIVLSWTDNTSNESGFRVERASAEAGPFETVGTMAPDVTTYTDSGLQASTPYYYRIEAYKGAESRYSTVVAVTTAAPPPPPPPPQSGLALSLNGYKVKGKHTVDLSWSGAGTDAVEIFRGGVLIQAPTNNPGGDPHSYTDAIGAKGGATYIYQVCETGSDPACSLEESVVF